MRVAGFLFLLIIVLYLILLPALGYKAEIGNSDAELQQINDDPKKFQIGIGLALIHNVIVITLTIMLFIVFSQYNIILGIVWTIFRIGEGLILSYNDKNYGGLLNIARKYSGTNGAEKTSLSDLARTITKTKSSRFDFAMIFWSIGTLAFSIVLVTYVGTLPQFIGWLGIVAGIFVGFGNGIKFVKPNVKDSKIFKILFSIGGLVAILFEIVLGGWLLFF